MKEEFQMVLNNKYEALEDEMSNNSNEIEEEWERLQKALNETTEMVIPKEKRRKKKKWMTDEILNLREEGCKWKIY